MSEQNKAKARRLFSEVWNKGDAGVVDELVAGNVVNRDPSNPSDVIGTGAYKQLVSTYRTAFPDIHFTIDDLIAEGDKAVCRWTARGTHRGDLLGIAATGKQLTNTGISIVRFEGGKAVEIWVNRDALGLMQQLGVVQPPGES